MEATGIVSRLKREDCPKTKHDSAFSHWKILIGPSDWDDHALGKEGAERYRVYNLAKSCSSPGLYELGIAVMPTGRGRETHKLDQHGIIVAYVGQADNVRTRLQQYGRSGAHLENGYSSSQLNDEKAVSLQKGLFREVFSGGYSIVFRWAPMINKLEAEKAEAQLLNKFDYAWNKGSNGVRRCDDILKKLKKSTSTFPFPKIVRRLQTLNQKQVGVRIKAFKPFSLESESGIYANQDGYDLLSRIFQFGRSHPRLVLDKCGIRSEDSSICGVALGGDSICRKPPVEGRKRCAEHKGMKVNSMLTREGKPQYFESGIIVHQQFNGHIDQTASYNMGKLHVEAPKCTGNEDLRPICGVLSDNSSPCRRQPAKGRKRCEDHKGMRVNKPTYKSIAEGNSLLLNGVIIESKTNFPPEICKPVKKEFNIICGVNLGRGFVCERRPVTGRKRCEEHKGMRVEAQTTQLNNSASPSNSYRRDANKNFSSACGAPTADGSCCRRKPVEGNKRCWQHKGRRAYN